MCTRSCLFKLGMRQRGRPRKDRKGRDGSTRLAGDAGARSRGGGGSSSSASQQTRLVPRFCAPRFCFSRSLICFQPVSITPFPQSSKSPSPPSLAKRKKKELLTLWTVVFLLRAPLLITGATPPGLFLRRARSPSESKHQGEHRRGGEGLRGREARTHEVGIPRLVWRRRTASSIGISCCFPLPLLPPAVSSCPPPPATCLSRDSASLGGSGRGSELAVWLHGPGLVLWMLRGGEEFLLFAGGGTNHESRSATDRSIPIMDRRDQSSIATCSGPGPFCCWGRGGSAALCARTRCSSAIAVALSLPAGRPVHAPLADVF